MRTRVRAEGLFRQAIPAIGLSVERSTGDVPGDGYYYVRIGEQIRGRFRSKTAALSLYRTLLGESGYIPPPVKAVTSRNESVERYLDAVEDHWSESHRHVRRGGKGRY